MHIDIYKTTTMLAAVKQAPPVTSFLRDRYFPTGPRDIFLTEDVLVEYKDHAGGKMAPVVMPRKGSINVAREGYITSRLTPPLVAPARPLTIDDINHKGFGEAVFSDVTPEQRQADLLLQDLADFDEMITNREEYMAAKCMFLNGYTLRQYADKYGSDEYTEYELRFYSGNSNPAIYTPSKNWGTTGCKVLDDIEAMVRMLTSYGNRAEDLLLGSEAADALINDTDVMKMLDIRNYNIGMIHPVQLPQGAACLGVLNVKGRLINLITYDATYVDETDGQTKPFVPAKEICCTAPGAGHEMFGAVSQVEQYDGNFHTYAARRVPRYWSEKNGREIQLSSRPILAPKTKNPFIRAKVIAD